MSGKAERVTKSSKHSFETHWIRDITDQAMFKIWNVKSKITLLHKRRCLFGAKTEGRNEKENEQKTKKINEER